MKRVLEITTPPDTFLQDPRKQCQSVVPPVESKPVLSVVLKTKGDQTVLIILLWLAWYRNCLKGKKNCFQHWPKKKLILALIFYHLHLASVFLLKFLWFYGATKSLHRLIICSWKNLMSPYWNIWYWCLSWQIWVYFETLRSFLLL